MRVGLQHGDFWRTNIGVTTDLPVLFILDNLDRGDLECREIVVDTTLAPPLVVGIRGPAQFPIVGDQDHVRKRWQAPVCETDEHRF